MFNRRERWIWNYNSAFYESSAGHEKIDIKEEEKKKEKKKGGKSMISSYKLLTSYET